LQGLALALALAPVLSSCTDDTSETIGTAPTPNPQAPRLNSVDPSAHAGAEAFEFTVLGVGFVEGDALEIDGAGVATNFVDSQTLTGSAPALQRGARNVRVRRGEAFSNSLTIAIDNSAPTVVDPGLQRVAEDELLELNLEITDFDEDPVRVFATGLPPGATFDEANLILRFTPDFIQGGDRHDVTITATDVSIGEGALSSTLSFAIEVEDTIAPPAPQIVNQNQLSDHTRITLSQSTDRYLDSDGYAGRTFDARITVPNDADANNRYPVRVLLHGFGGAPFTGGSADQVRIYPHDPSNSYWWGYSDQLPGGQPTSGTVPNYTQRRVLHLVEWVLRNYPGADPERVYLIGGSMGGAGAKALGLLYAHHFAFVYAAWSQTVPRNHRPARLATLSALWGTPGDNLPDVSGMGNWDRGDITRLLRDNPGARQQFIFAKHSKDDATIHFGAAVVASDLTQLSFYRALEQEHIGHYAVWDEGGHFFSDPVLGPGWWDNGFEPMLDPTSYLQRNLAFVAFSRSSLNRDPGDGSNGMQSWDASAGYAGSVGVAGDTGWNGELAGALNRQLRWDASAIVDELDRFEIPIWALDGMGGDPPAAGYPTTGDQLDGSLPVTVDGTVRRAQRFICLPGETIRWTLGADSGVVEANADGSVTVPALSLSATPTTLRLERDW
jgi:hypothetical protein